MPPTLPPDLADLARQLKLGGVEDRFGYRPGVFTAIPMIAASLLSVEYLLISLVKGVFAGAIVCAAVLAAALWWARRAWRRYRGGVYLFEGGIAEAYGNRVEKIFTWSELTRIQQRTAVMIGFLPLALFVDREWVIFADREDGAGLDSMIFYPTLNRRHTVLWIVRTKIESSAHGSRRLDGGPFDEM